MVLILSGPSCVGKGYAEQVILNEYPDAKKLRYFTTRPSIPEDDNGISLSIKDFANRVESGELVLSERRGNSGHFYAFSRDDLLKDDGVYMIELSPKLIQRARELIPESVAISFVIDPSEMHILKERMEQREIPELIIHENLLAATSTVKRIRENYRYYDASVLVTKKSEEKFSETILSLFRALVPAYAS